MPASDCSLVSTTSTASTTGSSSTSSSRQSTSTASEAPVVHSFKRRSIAFLPLLFCEDYHNSYSAESLGLVTLIDAGPSMTSRGMDRSVRQTFPSARRKARSSPRSSSVSADMRSVTKLEAQDLIEAEREYQRQQELEKCASDLAMEAMEYKFLSRRKRLMARKLMRESKDRSDPMLDTDLCRQQLRATRLDNNGNIVSVVPTVVPTLATGGSPQQRLSVQRSVAPDLALHITTKMDFNEPELLLEKPGAGRESTDQSLRSKHDREMKKYDESESNGRKRSRFTASLIRTNTSDSEQEPEEDSGYEAKSGITDTTVNTMDPSRAVSRGSFSSSLRPFSSDFESAWGSQELLESDSSVRKKSVKSRSSDDDREHDMFQDAEESLESIRQYGDFEAGGIETPSGYEVIDLPPNTRIEVKDKTGDKGKDVAKPMLIKGRKAVREGRRSTSDPVRDRLSTPLAPFPSVVRRGSTAMPYHFAMPTAPVTGYMKPTVASLRARYERDELEGTASAKDRYKISEEDNYRIKKVEEELKNKKLEEERTKRYEDWLKKLDEVNVIPQSAKERVKKLEEELFRLKKATEESEISMARAYRRRLLESDESELIFPMSRKTQTKPEPHYQIKMISRTTQTDEKPSAEVAVNTEIDYRLMSALLDKLLVAKTSVAVQTDWKSDVIETRDVAVATDRVFRERLSTLPITRSMSAQTEVSALQYKDESVSTDPEITGHRHRNRSVRESEAIREAIRLSSGVQTDQKWISRKDVSVEANLSSFSSESDVDSVVVSSAYPKGFHPKTGQLLDESLLANYQEINDQNINRFGVRSRDQTYHRLSKTPEPIIEEYGTSSSSSPTESNSEGDYSCENVREVYRERVAEYKSSSKPTQKSYYHMRTEEKKINLDFNGHKKHPKERPILETDLQNYDREPHRPEFRHKFTADKRPEVNFKSPQTTPTPSPKPVPIMKSTETQTNGNLMTMTEQAVPKPVMKVAPKDMKTESKITVEVTKANKKERSEVTSFTKMDEGGKMSRTTQVTTSKHVPVESLTGAPSMRELTSGRKTPTSSLASPQRSLSPMRKAQSEINVTPISNMSTRPSSADDLSMGPTNAPKIPSNLSFGSSYPSRSSLKTPSPTFKHYNSDEIQTPKVGRVSIQDPLDMVVLAPPERFDNKTVSMNGNGFLIPIDKSRWKETSSSTICNEMTTDAFKDEDGTVQKPKSISMSTETLIERKGNESSVKTRSRTARKYSNEAEEKAITSETSFAGPGGILKNDFPYIENESTSRSFSPPHRTSSSPVVTLVDTPDVLSPEPPEPMPKSTRMSRSTDSGTPSLVTDVRTSRFRPDEDKRLMQNTPRRAAVVEPVQHYSTVIKSEKSGAAVAPQPPVSSAPTEIITRIIRTSELDESKKFRKSKTVFEQELQSGRDANGGGCHISSSIAFDNPTPQNRGVFIREINEDGTSKDGSTDDLDQKSGELVTETNFQSFKTPKRGPNGCEETSWKYSVECNCINGSNTSVRTTIDYKRIKYPLTSYETSL